MPFYTFQARDNQGGLHRGKEQAASESALSRQLKERGWMLVKVSEQRDQFGASGVNLSGSLSLDLPIRSLDVEVSMQQIATMLRSGLTLLSALDTVARQVERKAMGRVWHSVSQRVQEGKTFTSALEEHRCFNRIVIQLCRVGETTGTLDQVMYRAAQILEARRNLRTSILTALIYPFLVFVMAIGVTAFMVFGVIPKLQKALNSFGRDMPAITQLLMDITTWLNTYIVHLALGVLFILTAIFLIYRTSQGKMLMDRFSLRIPLIGTIFRLGATVSFAHTVGVMLRSGITVIDALRTAAGLHVNSYLKQMIEQGRESVLGGGTVADALDKPHGYMPMMIGMIRVGEAAGTLDDSLLDVAEFHEERLKATIRRFSAIIEPVLILTVGGIVAFVYIAFFVALFAFAGG